MASAKRLVKGPDGSSAGPSLASPPKSGLVVTQVVCGNCEGHLRPLRRIPGLGFVLLEQPKQPDRWFSASLAPDGHLAYRWRCRCGADHQRRDDSIPGGFLRLVD